MSLGAALPPRRWKLRAAGDSIARICSLAMISVGVCSRFGLGASTVSQKRTFGDTRLTPVWKSH